MGFNIGVMIGAGNDKRGAQLARLLKREFPEANINTINMHAMVNGYWVTKANTKAKKIIGMGGRENFAKAMERIVTRYDAFVSADLAFANHVLPEQDVSALRDTDVLGGMLAEYAGKPILFLPDPLHLYGRQHDAEHQASYGLMFSFYIRKLHNRLHGYERPQRPMKFFVPTTIAHLRKCVEVAARSTLIATDVETANGFVSVVGFACNDPEHPNYIFTFVIPFVLRLENSNGLYWETELETKLAYDCLAEILANDVPKVMHNGGYDCSYFFRMGMPPNNFIYDTMIMMHSMWPTVSRALYMGASLFLPNYRYWKDDAKEVGEDDKQKWQVPNTIDRLGRYWKYNGQDCANTLELCLSILEYWEGDVAGYWPQPTYKFDFVWRTYMREFMLEFGPCMYMSMTGIRADRDRQEAMTYRLLGEAEKATERLRWIASNAELNPKAPAQIANLIYNGLGISGDRRKGETTDKRILQNLADKHPMIAQLIGAITSAKEPENNASKYGCAIGDRKGFQYFKGSWWLYQMKAAATTTRRLASSKHNYGFGCVRPTAKALTPTGWKAMTEIKDGDLIMQWENGQLSFAPCTMNWFYESQSLLCIDHEQLHLSMTKCHRTVSMNNRGDRWAEMSAADACRKGTRVYPVAGNFIGGTIRMPAYAAMLMADFSRDARGWYGSFKKRHKQLRVRELCAHYGLEYTETIEAREDYRRFTIRNAQIGLPKKWGPWVLEIDRGDLDALVFEARHWDAHVRDDSFIFFTADREQAEWFQTACALTGRGTTMRYVEQNEGSYSTTPMYCVNVKPRAHCRVGRGHWVERPYSGKVCCPTVPSSFWLVKDGDYISVTGNTNLQNIPAEMREVCVAEDDEILCSADYSQSDSYFVAFESQDEVMMETVMDDRDTHSVHVEFFFGFPYDDVVAGAKAKLAWVVHPITGVRQIIKKVTHGTNYDMGGDTMLLNIRKPAAIAMIKALLGSKYAALLMKYIGLDMSKTPEYYNERVSLLGHDQLAKACEFAQALYYKRYKRLALWKKDSVKVAATNYGVIHMFGGSTTTMLCAPSANPRFVPAAYGQGGTAGNINNAMLRLFYLNQTMWDRGFRMIAQIHDELLTAIPRKHMELVDEKVAIMETPCTIHGREFTIPVEAELSLSWTKKKTIVWKGITDETPEAYYMTKLLEKETEVAANFKAS